MQRWFQKNTDWVFLTFVFTAILITFFDVFLLKMSFVSGDHRTQHYPWGYFLHQQIRSGHIPLWTSLIQCGFPIMAEGQIGALYPLNLIFCLIPSFHFAYNYEILFHFVFGAALFYWLMRDIGIKPWGSFFSCLIYVLGSAHAGFFYNVTSQRVSVWFPLSLILINHLFRKPKLLTALLLGIVFALESLAGYQQIAVYVIGFAGLYFLWRLLFESHEYSKMNIFIYFFVAGIYSFLVSCPQWISFLELAQYSSRTSLVESFAYVGSVNPLGIISMLFPRWGDVFNSRFYAGILGVFFFFVSICSKKNQYERAMFFILILGVLLALGQFSPVYVLLIKISHFYGFRVPSKFLYFVSFAFSVLAGFGFDKFVREGASKSACLIFASFVIFGILVFFFGKPIFSAIRDPLAQVLRSYIQGHVIGSPIHPHSIETYYSKLNSIFDVAITKRLEIGDRWNFLAFFTILASCLILLLSYLKMTGGLLLKALFIIVLFLDLLIFSAMSIKTNYAAFAFVEQPSSQIIERLKSDKGSFRIYEFYQAPEEKNRFPIASNFNMIHGAADIGIYSPLAFKRYKAFLSRFGSVDDSLFSDEPTVMAVETNLRMLSALNVKYILSVIELHNPALELLLKENGVFLYQNHDVMPRAFFVDNSGKTELIRILKDDQQVLGLEGEFTKDGVVYISDTNYPGWKIEVNGKKIRMPPNELFRSIPVNKGNNRIVMTFCPDTLKWASFVSMAAMMILLIVFIRERR